MKKPTEQSESGFASAPTWEYRITLTTQASEVDNPIKHRTIIFELKANQKGTALCQAPLWTARAAKGQTQISFTSML